MGFIGGFQPVSWVLFLHDASIGEFYSYSYACVPFLFNVILLCNELPMHGLIPAKCVPLIGFIPNWWVLFLWWLTFLCMSYSRIMALICAWWVRLLSHMPIHGPVPRFHSYQWVPFLWCVLFLRLPFLYETQFKSHSYIMASDLSSHYCDWAGPFLGPILVIVSIINAMGPIPESNAYVMASVPAWLSFLCDGSHSNGGRSHFCVKSHSYHHASYSNV